jgi:hypothetical protein
MKEEEIRLAIDGFTREALADALAIVLSESETPRSSPTVMMKIEVSNFAQALQYLKKEYDFAELDLFSTEADLVYVQAGDRRVLLTKKDEEQIQNEIPLLIEGDGGRFSHLEL